MTFEQFRDLCKECEAYLRSVAPYKTGNLRKNSIKIEIRDDFTCRLYVEEGSGETIRRPKEGWHGIAPYMKYTNEPWKHGKNPNEGWFDRAAQHIAQLIAERLKGDIQDD